jgi:hypothetical protein
MAQDAVELVGSTLQDSSSPSFGSAAQAAASPAC